MTYHPSDMFAIVQLTSREVALNRWKEEVLKALDLCTDLPLVVSCLESLDQTLEDALQ